MNEIIALLENHWVCREQDRDLYNQVKRDTPRFQRFIREQLGWKLISNEHLLKLEKIPAHAESFMGILEFQEIRDYAILCIILMFLEDKEEQEQFLLSELIDYVGVELREWMEVDWNSFSQRKSLVRALQYVERMMMLRVYEGSSELLSQGIGQEVLYENTGFSRFFATSFSYSLNDCACWQDFEKERFDEAETNRGHFRINRVYRNMVTCPAMYWESNEDDDAIYLKNQRQWVAKYLEENLGGRLDIHKNAAFWVLQETERYGKVHPRDAQLPEIVLLLCGMIQEGVKNGLWTPESNGRIVMTQNEFDNLAYRCRDNWMAAWSKEYREMEKERFCQSIKQYMRDWMMLSEGGERVILYPAVAKQKGFYPPDYLNTEGEV